MVRVAPPKCEVEEEKWRGHGATKWSRGDTTGNISQHIHMRHYALVSQAKQIWVHIVCLYVHDLHDPTLPIDERRHLNTRTLKRRGDLMALDGSAVDTNWPRVSVKDIVVK